MYRYAIIGFGGLGKVHLVNLIRLERERVGELKLCAICGTNREALQCNTKLNFGTVDISSVDFSDCGFYQDYRELIDKEAPDFLISALPTNLHEEVAVYALSKGIHVLSEKPMALTVSGCDRMISAARESGCKLMIGQSMRFSPVYTKLKEYVDSQVFGKAYRMEFCRFSQVPLWTWNNWILDPEQSGGCILDMHVHDVDMMNWLFGEPKSLLSVGTSQRYPLECVVTQYEYENLVVTGSADWSMPQQYPFTERCLINFEKATVTYENKKLTVYTNEESYEPELEKDETHYYEMKAFVEMLLDGKNIENVISPESVRTSVKIALAETESLKTGRRIEKF